MKISMPYCGNCGTIMTNENRGLPFNVIAGEGVFLLNVMCFLCFFDRRNEFPVVKA